MDRFIQGRLITKATHHVNRANGYGQVARETGMPRGMSGLRRMTVRPWRLNFCDTETNDSKARGG